ncbi:MAG: hypothetical protein Q9170_001635 [Blastenia crenularia]
MHDWEELLLKRTKAAVEAYMSQPQFDASHDFAHVERVVALSQHIMTVESRTNPKTSYDAMLVLLAALVHDVDDHKYTDSLGGARRAEQMLLDLGSPPHLASEIQCITRCISYTKERSDPQMIRNTLQRLPELAVVQDADRLDALGAVGIARAFTYGGATQNARGLDGTILHFDEKLLNLEKTMKTQEGKRLARARTERLQKFKEWWKDETIGVVIPPETL